MLLPSPAGLPESLTYSIPEAQRQAAVVGAPVVAPLAGRDHLGYIIAIDALPRDLESARLKPLRAIPRPDAAFDAHTVELLRWAAREYRCSLADAMPLAVPERHGVEIQSVLTLGEWDGAIPPRVGLLTRQTLEAIYQALMQAGGTLPRDQLEAQVRAPNLQQALRRARTEGWVREDRVLVPPRVGPRLM
ncbi:MAG TPA: hypothetical protein VFU47_06205, partial [Armatimonadota bacterium]|nr:hypothetical protein [Armatimonadota bacterium]